MSGIILSNVPDYQSLYESVFEAFLVRNRCSAKTRKNYRSDIRNFFHWLIRTIHMSHVLRDDPKAVFQLLTVETIADYKSYLQSSGFPASTANRRLSGLRMFFECAAEAGWISHNPAADVPNLYQNKPTPPAEVIIVAFTQALVSEGAPKSTIRSYVSDVTGFIVWHRSRVMSKQSEDDDNKP